MAGGFFDAAKYAIIHKIAPIPKEFSHLKCLQCQDGQSLISMKRAIFFPGGNGLSWQWLVWKLLDIPSILWEKHVSLEEGKLSSRRPHGSQRKSSGWARPPCMHVQSLSGIRLFATSWTAACQAPLSMGFFSRQEYGVGCHFLLQGRAPYLVL